MKWMAPFLLGALWLSTGIGHAAPPGEWQTRAEFEQAVAVPAFAASPERRFDFVYRRTPYYDERLNLYPIGRILFP